MVNLYTDGSVRCNYGGLAYIIEIGGYIVTEHKCLQSSLDINYLELKAVVEGLKAISDPSEVTIFTDSNYVINAISPLNPIKMLKELNRKFSFKTMKGKLRNELLEQIARHKSIEVIPVYRFNKNYPLHTQAHNLAKEVTTINRKQ